MEIIHDHYQNKPMSITEAPYLIGFRGRAKLHVVMAILMTKSFLSTSKALNDLLSLSVFSDCGYKIIKLGLVPLFIFTTKHDRWSCIPYTRCVCRYSIKAFFF